MVDHPTSLDAHRGMAAQKATELRRLRSEVEADQAALHARQRDLEDLLAAAPAATWPEAVEKARYLLGLFAQSAAAADRRVAGLRCRNPAPSEPDMTIARHPAQASA